MQHSWVCNFRARLLKAGYTGISIKRQRKKFSDQEIYLVIAYDPLGHMRVERYMDVYDMERWR